MLQRDRRVPPRPSLGIVEIPKAHIYDPETPNLYKLGGLVEANQMGRPPTYSYMKVKNINVDAVPTLLQHGELVIPVKHVDKVAKFLKSQNINLPNMDKLP
jgi:hypothetical protein